MVKHVSVRFAWHDNKWNGCICSSPSENVYCVDNYSLLSARIQRRRNLEIEERFKGDEVSHVVNTERYLPPCYWCINVWGDKQFTVEDPHPFGDVGKWANEFRVRVPPLKDMLNPFSVFTWCFKLSFNREDSPGGKYPRDLEERVERYLNEIKPGKSIAFFYANYSNPITGDEYKRLLLGAGLIREVIPPKRYEIPEDLLQRIRSVRDMQNFPEVVWQFQIVLDPDTIFMMPFHEYLEWMKQDNSMDISSKQRMLEEVSIKIEGSSIEPHFKYVSMHISHDKAIYLLYLFKKSLRKMKEHEIVSKEILEEIESKLNVLLKIAWTERGRYPGFKSVAKVLLSNDFNKEHLESLMPRIEEFVVKNYGSVGNYLEMDDYEIDVRAPAEILSALRIIEGNREYIKFLSLFDFSVRQFENILEIIGEMGFGEIRRNPYILLEKYYFDEEDYWHIDESDYGLDVYQIDIALIPDPEYADWSFQYSATSPERLRALITKFLRDVALNEGHTYLTRREIVKYIEDYPLYYIGGKLRINAFMLTNYEKQPVFREKFIIKEDKAFGEVTYQLKIISQIEKHIEKFIEYMLKKKYDLGRDEEEYIKNIVGEERQILMNRGDVEVSEEEAFIEERIHLYKNALSNGLFVISGKAGSGKTQAVIKLVQRFREKGLTPIYVFTPTGKASLVIRRRLKEKGLHKDHLISVSTIHRFLYRALFEAIKSYTSLSWKSHQDVFKLVDLVSKITSGKYELFNEYVRLARRWRFGPKVVIIDEASMVDETLMALLFCLLDYERLSYLILSGDKKQLPPIGIGRPFTDVMYYLERKESISNYISLKTNLRFSPNKKLGRLSDLFAEDKCFTPANIEHILKLPDDTLELYCFSDLEDLKRVIQGILCHVGNIDAKESLFDMFREIFEKDESDLEKVQILSTRRVGKYGTMDINWRVILDNNIRFSPGTKLICEENIYINVEQSGKKRRVLGLANGSIGYVIDRGNVYFDEIIELAEEYGERVAGRLTFKIWNEIENPLKIESCISPGYAITVHKAQGSDFEHIILIIPNTSPFITRELLYTAFTRAKRKLHLVIYKDLVDELSLILTNSYENSIMEQLRTTLFGFKKSPSKPFTLVLKNGKTLAVRSKIEFMIAKTLDELGIEFEYEPEDFRCEYRVLPDFKFIVDDRTYYLEHLGRMDKASYRERWFQKFEIYKKLGIDKVLITTSEMEETRDISDNIEKIINDIKTGNLKKTEGGYSYHHYLI